ncbi:hypothetical protein GV829_04515 [Sphingomonas lacunae]|uniref:Uncharacterized protein n=1 Tax=Sphingomonas lacunae TaxID=2698828 RepID=A0A6M4ART7_9SPHN|nr:hypothetical protein [Sphingomonas lacunae]QJQ31798.1 hypothetical protein GV829_04515 [Sphingomonas lacunae]
MPFEALDYVGPTVTPKAKAVPIDGVRVTAQRLGLKVRGNEPQKFVRYIRIDIGKKLAKDMALHGQQLLCSVLFGIGTDAGKIRIAVDATAGRFTAKANKKGEWFLTINEATADGLFALEFPTFCVLDIRPHCSDRQPPSITFSASAEMLEAD